MHYYLFDNSVLAKFRTSSKKVISHSAVKLLNTIAEKHEIDFKKTFLTQKLFIELINQGKLRETLVKLNHDLIHAEKKKVLDLINAHPTILQSALDEYLTFLENFFVDEFIKKLPRYSIIQETNKPLKNYKLSNLFVNLESQVKQYSKRLFKSESIYMELIMNLVEDSVIRFLLDIVNLREIPKKNHDKAFDIVGYVVKSLLIKYSSKNILKSNLTLLASGLKYHIESSKATKESISQLIRVKDDLLDCELPHYALFGKKIGNSTYPITVITAESEERVKERLKYCFQSIGTISSILFPQTIILGTTINLDFNNSTYQVIETESYIRNNFKYAHGGSIC